MIENLKYFEQNLYRMKNFDGAWRLSYLNLERPNGADIFSLNFVVIWSEHLMN